MCKGFVASLSRFTSPAINRVGQQGTNLAFPIGHTDLYQRTTIGFIYLFNCLFCYMEKFLIIRLIYCIILTIYN